MIDGMGSDILDTFGKRIRAARDHAGVNQTELAAKLGVLQSRISHIETGVRMPHADEIAQIATELEVTADYLLLLSTDFERPKTKPEPEPIGYSEQAEEAAKLIDGLASDAQRQYCVEMLRLFTRYQTNVGKEWAGIIESIGQVSPEGAHLISQHLLQGKPFTDLPGLLDALAKSERKKPLTNVN